MISEEKTNMPQLTGKTINAALGARFKSNSVWDMSDSVKSLFGYVPHNFTDDIEEPALLKKKS